MTPASPLDAEMRAFVGDAMVTMVASASARRRPFLTPLWFAFDGEAFFMTTGGETWAARNVRVRPDVVLLFGGERGARDERVLRVDGVAGWHAGMPPVSVLARIAAKYYLTPSALAAELRHAGQWLLRLRYYAQVSGGAGYLRVVPTGAAFERRP